MVVPRLNVGSIIRLKLVRFLTYEDVEFYPKPGLNMIIGPNGSGKSSLVCAICLAVGGKPNLLGRAQHVKDFIKHGHSSAELEIELFAGDDKANVIIHRTIGESRSSEWKINGKTSSLEQVHNTVTALNIQVDNLCQFLPQDRVADFVKMTPQQLLVGTQSAVGSTVLMELHESLKQMQIDLQQLEKSVKGIEDKKQKQIQLNQHLEADLLKYREFKESETQLSLYKAKLAWLYYVEKREKFFEMKTKLKGATKLLQEREKEKDFVTQKMDKLTSTISSLEGKLSTLGKNLSNLIKEYDVCSAEVARRNDKIADVKHAFTLAMEAEKERKAKISSYKEQYESALATYEKHVKEAQEMRAEEGLELVKDRLNELSSLKNKILAKVQERRTAVSYLESSIQDAEASLRVVRSRVDSRIDILREKKKGAYNASVWLKQNADKFKKRIYNPVLTEMEVLSPDAVKYLENSINSDTFYSFVAEDADDIQKFVKVCTQNNWKVNVCQAPAKPREFFQPPISIAKLAPYGAKGYLSDLFKAPDAVYRLVCANHQLHKIPYGNASLSDHIDVLHKNHSISICCTPTSKIKLSVSKYGSRDTIISDVPLKKPQILQITKQSNEEENLVRQISAWKEELKTTHKEWKDSEKELPQYDEEIDKHKEDEKNYKTKLNDVRRFKDFMTVKKTQYNRLLQAPTNIEEERAKVKTQLRNEILHQQKQTQQMTKLVSKINHELSSIGRLHCELIETQSTARNARQELDLTESALDAAVKTFKKLDEETAEAKKEALDLFKQAKSLVGLDNAPSSTQVELPPDVVAKFQTLSNDPVEIEGFVSEENARLALMMPDNTNVEEEYEARCKDIEKLSKDLDKALSDLAALKERMSESDRQWRSELDELLKRVDEKFGEFFSSLGCCGKVQLYTGEADHQYDKYGIKIFVKFRDHEQLCELTPFHQSGGERSVSTILYMMALQELTVVPFRVVDEINQGMDSSNERRVFEFIVRTAEANSAQYFLITPKLLPGLPYSENMYVHTISPNSGIPHHKWSIQNFLTQRRALDAM